MSTRRFACLDAIALELSQLHVEDVDLGRGSAGNLVFAAHLAKWTGKPEHLRLANSLLDRTLDLLETTEFHGLGLYHGIAGVAWALRHAESVCPELVVPELSEIDALVEASYRSKLGTAYSLDLISGVAGVLVYLTNAPRNNVARAIYEAIVKILEVTAVRQSSGLFWPCGTSNTNHTDLGVAHGTPGIVGALCFAEKQGYSSDSARALADAATMWVLQQVRTSDSGKYVSYSSRSTTPARVAWCYGAPGISCAMLQAEATDSNSSVWHALATNAALRREDTGVTDAGLCHGEAGLLHLFLSLHRATGALQYKAAARHWESELIRNWRSVEGFAGFRMDNRGTWSTSSGYLEGAAGVGLALLSALGAPKGWDAPLLTL
jgi:lantibiotic modifying enzyme